MTAETSPETRPEGREIPAEIGKRLDHLDEMIHDLARKLGEVHALAVRAEPLLNRFAGLGTLGERVAAQLGRKPRRG